MTEFLTYIAFGTLGFWVLAIAACIGIIASLEHDDRIWPTIIVIGFTALYWKTITSIDFNWRTVVAGIAVYLITGMSWSVFRWHRHIQKIVTEYVHAHGGELTEHQLSMLNCDTSPNRHKSLLMGWIAYWPWSVAWNIVGDLIIAVYNMLQGTYASISKHQLKKIKIKPDENIARRSPR